MVAPLALLHRLLDRTADVVLPPRVVSLPRLLAGGPACSPRGPAG